ncbi:MAG: hypothetical protein GF411_05285 [Candidatus Lokiarchaeota archaeon]|nr:hypothetical protein [Candidatus Lokiarchaeota archaeon]
MSENFVEEQLSAIIADLVKTKTDTASNFEKLRVALSNVFRLLKDERTTTLVALHGNPNNLITYILELTNKLQVYIDASHDNLLSQLILVRDSI